MRLAAKRFAAREALLLAKEEAAKARVLKEKADLAEKIQRRDAETADTAEARNAALHRTFRRAEAQLKATLASQHALVSERYGKLVPGRAGARQLRIEWHKLPQPVEIRVSRLRAVKSKLPSGRYVMLVTLYDRLGGNPVKWTKIGFGGGGGDASRPGATTAVRHRGRYYDTELDFNQCIYAVAPSQADLRPSHVFIFELFCLGGRSNPIDRVVAWSALPACDRDFQVMWGRYKVPLLRGEVDMAIDKYKLLEAAIERDLDNWMTNMYLEVRLRMRIPPHALPRVPRSLATPPHRRRRRWCTCHVRRPKTASRTASSTWRSRTRPSCCASAASSARPSDGAR